MKNLKNWLNSNNFNFELKESIIGKELIFINIQGIGGEQVKRIKTYLKRYKFTFEYRCNYTYILAKKEEEKIYKTIDNSIVQAATKENKINDLSIDKNINTLITDIKKSIKYNTNMIILENGIIRIPHYNGYSTDFNLINYNLNSELQKDQKEYIQNELDLYIYSFNYDTIDTLKNEIELKYNAEVTKENYKTLSIKTKDNLIKIVYNFNVDNNDLFTVIIKNAVNKIHKEKNKNCVLSILSHVLKSNNKLIEKANKLIESIEKEPIKEEFYNNEVEQQRNK